MEIVQNDLLPLQNVKNHAGVKKENIKRTIYTIEVRRRKSWKIEELSSLPKKGTQFLFAKHKFEELSSSSLIKFEISRI